MSSPGNSVCAVCDRHLLRGEEPEVFLDDGSRCEVCELCVPRALHAGWIRVGATDAPTLEPARTRGARSVVERLLRRRRPAPRTAESAAMRSASRRRQSAAGREQSAEAAPEWRPHRVEDEVGTLALQEEPAAAPLADYATTATGDPAQVSTAGARMIARAIDLYNHSSHPRTLSGIARTLGAPWVTVRSVGGSRVRIVIAWELTWYRFEVDLAREADGVLVVDQGTALDGLEPGEVEPNAVADDHGYLYLQTATPVA